MNFRDVVNVGEICIYGHIGVGHVHSHSGFVQDDGAGFAVAATLLNESLPINTIIKSAESDLENSLITISTKDGGIGKVFVPSGITPWEKEIINDIVGMNSIYVQEIILKSFGRLFGQGAMELAVSLQAAIALSLLDTFKVKYPDRIHVVDEDISLNNGKILESTIKIVDIPISIVLSINSTQGGIGPIEDLEGNIPLGNKGKLIKDLGLEKIPSIVIESKNYSPAMSNDLEKNTFLIRANETFDNLTVAKSLIESAKEQKIEYDYNFSILNRDTDDLENSTRALGKKIIQLGKQFENAKTSYEKVNIIHDLNKLAREDAGGVTFMSNKLNRSVGGAGMLKGTSAVLSLVVTKEYIEYNKIPYITKSDIEDYVKIIKGALPKIYEKLEVANAELEEKFDFDPTEYDFLFQ